MDVKEKLAELLAPTSLDFEKAVCLADYLVKNGVTVQEWIPVTERLPEPYVSVLVLRQKLDDGGRFQKIDHTILANGGEFEWFMDMSSWKSKVTHWMPLPQPPKGE